MTKRYVILSAEHERIRNTLKRETDCRGAKAPRNDKEQGRRIATRLAAVSPAGSVGASAPQRCPPDTRTALTEHLVILSAEHERIRNTLKRETDCRGAKALRNDKEQGRRIATAVYTALQ